MNSSRKAAAMTRDETILLVQLVAANAIINNKATNAKYNKLKEDAWKILTDEFNSSVSGSPRTPYQLRLRWENLKKAARKRSASLRSNLNKTGGKDYFPSNEVLDKVTSLLGSTCKGFDVGLGKDSAQLNTLVLDEVHTVVVKEEVTDNSVVGDSDGVVSVDGENVADRIGSFTPTSEKKSHCFCKASGSVSLAKRKLKMEEEKCKARINRDNAITEYIIAKKKRLDLDIAKIELELENARLENIALKRKLNLLD